MLRFTCKWTWELFLQKFLCFQTRTVLFKPFFKYHVIFEDRSEANISEHNIIDMIEGIIL